jgi:hypothetical protein
VRGGFECGYVHLDHAHHGFGVTDQFTDIVGHDLLLRVAANEEREGGVELIRRAAVEKDHLLAFEFDGDGGYFAHGPGADSLGAHLIELARVREDAQ